MICKYLHHFRNIQREKLIAIDEFQLNPLALNKNKKDLFFYVLD